MKFKQILAGLLAVAAIGVLVFLFQKTQTVDGDLHLQRLQRLRTIDNLDVALNRAVSEARVTNMSDVSDNRSQITRRIGEALSAIDKGGSESLYGLSPKLDEALDLFLDTIQDKFELGFDFDAQNIRVSQRLTAGMDAVPGLADTVAALAPADLRDMTADKVRQLKSEIISFGVVPSPINEPDIRKVLEELTFMTTPPPPVAAPAGTPAPAAEAEPAAEVPLTPFAEAVKNLRSTTLEVVADKNQLVKNLNDFLGRATGAQLQAVEQAYTGWHESEVAEANRYRQYLVGYAAALLLVLAFLGLRLSRSYRDLDKANASLLQANSTLEDQVQSRTKDLRSAITELKSSQAQLVQSEKMASLGQMVAGVAHEINTPLGYARSNAEIVRNALNDIRGLCTAQDRALTLMTQPDASNESIAEAVADAEAQRQNLNAVELIEDLNNLLQDADHGMVQIADLVGSLKDFSRVDRSRNDVFNINDGIESALKIAHNQLKHKVEVLREFGEVPHIQCSPSQINQVFLNLFTNAAQAIETQGTLTIRTAANGDGVTIHVADSGCGMSEDVQRRIFEPFFTTKPVGKGTGLGLSIVFRIIEEHGGRIAVQSAPGQGTQFEIWLPLKQKAGVESSPSVALAA